MLYPDVSLEQLNQYVKEFGPLCHPELDEHCAFFVDEGLFVPVKTAVLGHSLIGSEISGALINWAKWGGHGGRVTGAQGEYVLDDTMLRVPDVAYVPRDAARELPEAQLWTRGGEPFAPTFVVEIDTLAGQHSNFDALDHNLTV